MCQNQWIIEIRQNQLNNGIISKSMDNGIISKSMDFNLKLRGISRYLSTHTWKVFGYISIIKLVRIYGNDGTIYSG